MRKMKAVPKMGFRDLGVSFPPKKLYVTITRGEFGWEIDASFVQNQMGFFGATAPNFLGIIDDFVEYVQDDLTDWVSFDANKRGK